MSTVPTAMAYRTICLRGRCSSTEEVPFDIRVQSPVDVPTYVLVEVQKKYRIEKQLQTKKLIKDRLTL